MPIHGMTNNFHAKKMQIGDGSADTHLLQTSNITGVSLMSKFIRIGQSAGRQVKCNWGIRMKVTLNYTEYSNLNFDLRVHIMLTSCHCMGAKQCKHFNATITALVQACWEWEEQLAKEDHWIIMLNWILGLLDSVEVQCNALSKQGVERLGT